MKIKHNAFTLTEVMISLSIIGIIMCFYIPVKKTIDNLHTTLGYFAYINVNNIARTLISGSNLNYVETASVGGVDQIIFIKDDRTFCEGVVDITNTVGTTNCSSLYTASGTEISSLNVSNPTFVTTNGNRYYLSRRVASNTAVSNKYGYRVLAIDLNGKRNPNAVAGRTTGSQMGDIINFVIFDNGDVFPAGQAATDRNYVNAHVKAYKYDGGDGGKNPFTLYYLQASNGTTTMPYSEAYCKIHGSTTHLKMYNCSAPDTICPLGDAKADTCVLELVKPVYRFKM